MGTMEGVNPSVDSDWELDPSIGSSRVDYFYLKTEAEVAPETWCFRFKIEPQIQSRMQQY
jgi:hypothetical protein